MGLLVGPVIGRRPARRPRARSAAADDARRRGADRREPGRHGALDQQRGVRRVSRRASARPAPTSRSPAPIRRADLQAEVGAWRVKGADPTLLLPAFQGGRAGLSATPLTKAEEDVGGRAVTRIGDPGPAGAAGRSMSSCAATRCCSCRRPTARSPKRRWASCRQVGLPVTVSGSCILSEPALRARR